MTSLEVSKRLKEAGFIPEHCPSFYLCNGSLNTGFPPRGIGWTVTGLLDGEIPAYDAETLFVWLAEQRSKRKVEFTFDNEDLFAYKVGTKKDVGGLLVEYKTSLADMLGNAIIWMLENK